MKKQVEYLQKLFYDLWNDFGKVYLLVRYSGNSVIRTRGFTEEEQEQGLVLVFNNKTNNRMEWDGEGNISCVLAFGTRREEVYLHHDDLLGVFSPEAGVQFVRSDVGKESKEEQGTEDSGKDRVVSMNNFRKSRGQNN